MGTKYTTQGITGYDADPPDDDGTESPANKVAWVNHTEKIGDPIVNQVAAIDTKIVTMVDVATSGIAGGTYTTVEDDDGRVIECTSSPDITLGLAATMGSGYKVTIKTVSGTTTVSLGGADEIDGSASDRTLVAGASETYVVNEAEDGYLIAGGTVLVPIATSSHSFGSLTPGEVSSTWGWTHGLGTDDVDFGFSVLGSSNSNTTICVGRAVGGYQVSMIGGSASADSGMGGSPDAPASGELAFRVKNTAGGSQTITIKVWARTR